jgi:hypothetical protein
MRKWESPAHLIPEKQDLRSFKNAKDFLWLTSRHYTDMAFDDIETMVEFLWNQGVLQDGWVLEDFRTGQEWLSIHGMKLCCNYCPKVECDDF